MMVRTRFRLALAAGLAALAAACSDSTAPTSHGQLELSAADAPTLHHHQYPDRSWGVQCTEPVTAQLHADAGHSITWLGATFSWFDAATGRLLLTRTIGADSLAYYWGSSTLGAGQSQDLLWDFWNTEPFKIRMDFQYRETGTQALQIATVNFTCAPAGKRMEGMYALSTINGVRVPAYGVNWDTLTFFPNVTYTTSGSLGDLGSHYGGTTGPDPYDVISESELSMPILIFGEGTGESWTRSGTTLTYVQRDCCGRPSTTWRFDLVGSNPQLPPPPVLVPSATSVTFTAQSGGALPEVKTVQITASTASAGQQIPNLSWTATSACNNGVGCMNDWMVVSLNAAQTPATLQLKVYSTALPAGTYKATVFVTTNAAQNAPLPIAVTLTLTP
jgi:hypothetical protein